MPQQYDDLIIKEDFLRFYFWKLFGNNRPTFHDDEVQSLLGQMYSIQKEHGTLPFIVPYLELSITPRCSLRCQHCANFMPLYRNSGKDYSIDSLCASLDKVFASVDAIKKFRILGGEPLLHKDLAQLLRFITSFKKTGRAVIVTNGTLLPTQKVISAAQETGTIFEISHYGELSCNAEKLQNLLKEKGISFSVHNNLVWQDYGHQLHSYTEKEIKHVYHTCNNNCITLVHDQLHICPRSAHGMNLGLIPNNEKEYIHVPSISIPELRERFQALYRLQSIAACRLCIVSAKRSNILAAEQMS